MGSRKVKKAARVTANVHQIRRIFGVTCAYSGCAGSCDDYAGDYGDDFFETCPIRFINSPRWSVILRLYSASKVSPLADWPFGFVPWVVDGLTNLKNELDKVAADAQKEALKNG